MYRFALRPRWLLSHLFVLTLVVVMVNLGFWQLRRLDERKDTNRVVRERIDQPVVAFGTLLRPDDEAGVAVGVEYRRVRVTGSFGGGRQALVRSRSLDGSPGSWVLAPLRQDDGTIVVINRGWISNDGSFDAVPPAFAAPVGRVTVTGLVQRTQARGRFGPTDPPTGRLTSLARVDIGRYARQLDAPVAPAWVQLTAEDPTPKGTVPRILDPPTLDEGPHLSYAAQWFIFSTIALVGYPMILRRNAREHAADRANPVTGTDDAPPDPDGPDPGDRLEPGDPRLDARPAEGPT